MLRFWPLLSALYYWFGFVFPDTGTYSSYLLAHVWGRRKIRSRCDTTSWFTGSPIDRELPTNANGRAFATRCTTKRHYTTRFGISGGSTQKYVYVHVYVMCMYECIWMWALMQQRQQREFTMHLSLAAHPIFSVRWSVSCRQLNMDSSRMYVH